MNFYTSFSVEDLRKFPQEYIEFPSYIENTLLSLNLELDAELGRSRLVFKSINLVDSTLLQVICSIEQIDVNDDDNQHRTQTLALAHKHKLIFTKYPKVLIF